MSLVIKTTQITAVYALGQWHSVWKGTFRIDAYELAEELSPTKDVMYFYQLGYVYPEIRRVEPLTRVPGSIGENWHFLSPQGSHGCQWVDSETSELVSMSLLEIKGWKEAFDD